MRGGVPPNVVIVYEKGSAIMNRAYSGDYNPATTYYGFFDSTANYTYDSAGYFIKSGTCTPSTTINTNCFSGNVLNWALMSSLDLSRKALIGFGNPEPGRGRAAGELFRYKDKGTLDSKGQANAETVSGAGNTF
ncbi:type IV pilus assembly protein PilY1 [Candidatus Hakubella thermalkaliphila]|uniref:Type IV pilus assembly protein PilY1 n=1 Tax=Candidatus Hakubella thermalkaliphila TaxID=2754717 RepID=A0A6V8PG72_9ACTN|nr:type IV pilus assembly protein PilY1 [Candidatus Hakubella thermalkaliphila]